MLKKLFIYLSLGLVLSLAINLLYERYLRPDNLFFTQCLHQSRNWEERVRAEGESCYVFSGGSEVRMGIEPVTMWNQHHLAAINAGVQAGNSARANAQIALSFLKRGDTLVVSHLSHGINDNANHSGVNFCFRHLGFAMFSDNVLKPNLRHVSMLLFGDSQNYGIHLMRILTRPECIYRYSSAENAQISESGRVEVLITSEQNNKITSSNTRVNDEVLMSGWKSYIEDLRAACAKRGSNLIVYISRHHCSDQNRHQNIQAALYLTRLGVPVLKDPMLGCWETDTANSDTSVHLSVEAGREFSSYLAELIKTNSYWSEEELQQLLNEYNKFCTSSNTHR